MPTDDTSRLRDFGAILRRRREDLGFTLKSAGEAAQVSVATWGDAELGKKRPQGGTLRKMERLLQFSDGSLRDFLAGGPEPTVTSAGRSLAPPVHADELAAKAPPISSLTTEQDGQGRFQIRVVDKAGREVVVLAFPGSVTMTPETIEYLAKIATGVSLDEHTESETDA